jgi:hypothetical protein
MPENILKYKIFLASPSDLDEERVLVQEVIDELNLTYGDRNHLIIELIKWETHSAPGVGDTDSQSVIEKDLGFDYDIFIGMIWKKFGTNTRSFDSGTEQEFHQALNLYKNQKLMNILFYFKDSTPSNLNLIDPEELIKIRNFKKRLELENIFYRSFSDGKQLQSYLRIHIPIRIESSPLMAISEVKNEADIEKDSSADEGIYDYIQTFQESFQEVTNSLNNTTISTNLTTNELNKKTDEMNKMKTRNPNINIAIIINMLKDTSLLIDTYSDQFEPNILTIKANMEKGIYAMTNMISIYKEVIKDKENSELLELKNMIETLINALDSSINTTSNNSLIFKQFPRLEKNLNRAVNRVSLLFENYTKQLEFAKSLLLECKNIIE